MTLSTGVKIENSRRLATYEDDLAKAQRANKARRVQAIHAKISAQGDDEDRRHLWAWQVCRDASTGMSRNMLRYKAIARGATFVDTSEYLTAQTCSECGSIGGPEGNAGLEIRDWTCSACGSLHDRDVNAARNILRLGRQALVEGSSTISAQR
jgi:putative transposase